MSDKIEAQNRALNTLVAAARIGQAKGAYSLEEATAILEAIKVFEQPPPQAAPQAEAAPEAAAS